ncbi:MAG: FAD-binding oxidoreductase, partial [Pirellulales bacterium]|nr:FAD-binding oxidoreductase [Pirellulales bacterium]
MTTSAVIVGMVLVGIVAAQLSLASYASIQAIFHDRRRRQMAQILWWERIELANVLRAERQQNQLAWNGYRKFVVDQKVVEADGVCSFYLKPHDAKPLPRFKPGQYLTFQLDLEGQPKPILRCYSLSDGPNPDYYRVTIKRVPAPAEAPEAPPGLGSNYFHDEVQEGNILDVKAPGGHFALDAGDQHPAVLVGGGVGITPVLSMINSEAASGSTREIWLFYGTRNGREHVMRDHLRDLARNHENLHVIICYSRPQPDEVEGRDYDEAGHLSVQLIQKYLSSSNYRFFVCGPPAMMKTFPGQLEEWGVPKADILTEAFGPASVKARQKVQAPQEGAAKDAAQQQITFSHTGKKLT